MYGKKIYEKKNAPLTHGKVHSVQLSLHLPTIFRWAMKFPCSERICMSSINLYWGSSHIELAISVDTG